ncbi:hypothetical protein [Chryseobacterium sp. CH21]|uniref:hypothetical protein n=1 Tax=Chryseobacterium sp. CH21 TaxID=713556 RepID=UPI0013E93084|nr:hypothetical protein [Chryseobacterium sp. CH21]
MFEKGEVFSYVSSSSQVMGSMNRRYDRYFEELLRFARTFPNYKAVITDKNSL